MSTETLTAAVSDISSVVSMSDRISGSAPGNGSRAAVGEDLVSMTNCRLQARSFITQDGGTTNGIRKFKRHIRGKTLDVGSSGGSMNDNLKQLSASEASQQESTATSNVKKAKAEVVNYMFLSITFNFIVDITISFTVSDLCHWLYVVSCMGMGLDYRCIYLLSTSLLHPYFLQPFPIEYSSVMMHR
jgi:hypothetical protein